MTASTENTASPRNATDAYPDWPVFDQEQIDAAATVLRSGKVNYWTGTEGRQFESEFAAYCGARHGVAVANGSLALELALRALRIGPGDEVVVTARSFIASASCVLLSGARPVFADIDPDSQNVTADSIQRVLTDATRAIIVVHLAGWPCDMAPIAALAQSHGLRVIEDCSQAHGAEYHGRRVGSLGCAATFSFCHEKAMTTAGEGGMLVTSDQAVFERARSFRDHGTDFARMGSNTSASEFRWLRNTPGSNLRLSEVQAAVGRLQLRKLPQWLTSRECNAAELHQCLADLPALRIPLPPGGVRHAWYRFTVFLRPERLLPGWNRDRLLAAIREAGVPCSAGACPELYRERAFRPDGSPHPTLPTARQLGETSMMFCVHPTLERQHMRQMGAVIAALVRNAQRG